MENINSSETVNFFCYIALLVSATFQLKIIDKGIPGKDVAIGAKWQEVFSH